MRISIPVSVDTVAQVLTMDIGFGDIVTPAPVDLDYPALLEHLPTANILAYSLETVVAEKMHAVIDLADQSSRMKDYYDLYQILNTQELGKKQSLGHSKTGIPNMTTTRCFSEMISEKIR